MTEKITDAAEFIVGEIKSFALACPSNRLPGSDNDFIFDEPLVGFAAGGDPLFTEYKGIIAPAHLTPREALATAVDISPAEAPSRLSVISWVLPISGATRRSNAAEKRLPSRAWSHTRWFGEIFNDALRSHLVKILSGRGYLAAAPAAPEHLKTFTNESGMYSCWSERHIAFAAGLGTFSLSDGFITERGIAHRCGSVVTSLEIPASPRTARGPYDNCLFYAGQTCRRCIERCPEGAITDTGHNKIRCQQYLREISHHPDWTYDLDNGVIGCGLCQTGVPCEAVNPVAEIRKKSA